MQPSETERPLALGAWFMSEFKLPPPGKGAEGVWEVGPSGPTETTDSWFLVQGFKVFLDAISQLRLAAGGCSVPGSAPVRQRVLLVPRASISSCQGIEIGGCVIILRSKDFLEVLDGRGILLSIGKNAADMEVGEAIFWPSLDRPFKALQSFIQLALPLKHHPQIVVGLSRNGISRQGAPEGLLRFSPLSRSHKEHTIIIMSVRKIGIQTNRFPVVLLGLFGLIHFPVENDEIRMGHGQLRIKFEGFQVRCD